MNRPVPCGPRYDLHHMQLPWNDAAPWQPTFADESWSPAHDDVIVLAQANAEAASEFAALVRPLVPEGTEIKGRRIGKFIRKHPSIRDPLEQLISRCEICVHDSGVYRAEIRGTLIASLRRTPLLPPSHVSWIEEVLVNPLASLAALENSLCQRLRTSMQPRRVWTPGTDPRVLWGHNQALTLARSDAALIDAVRPEIEEAVACALSDARFIRPERHAAELALCALQPDRWFDLGNMPSIESLLAERTALHALAVDACACETDSNPGKVEEVDSCASTGVQLADLAAGRALRDYKRNGLSSLVDRHPLVLRNGLRVSAA